MSDNTPPENHNFLLGQIDAKIKILMEMLSEAKETFAAHETRIRALEHGRAWMLGAAAVIGFVVSILVKLIL